MGGIKMKHILLDFPHQIETERLLLRLPKPGDGQEVNEAIRTSIEELQPWMPFAKQVPEVEETESNIRKAHAKFLTREDLRFHIYHKEQGNFIGSTGLHYIDWKVPKFEIGYWVKTSESKKGYVTEAIKALAQFAFQELKAKRVEIECDSRNERSRKVAERLGFTLEGILKNDDRGLDGSLRDTCIYAITNIEELGKFKYEETKEKTWDRE
jgi:ribosomal-protein-serine acetyltransferase